MNKGYMKNKRQKWFVSDNYNMGSYKQNVSITDKHLFIVCCLTIPRSYMHYKIKTRSPKYQGPVVQNDSLKFTSSEMQICWIFLLKKIWVAFKLLTFFFSKKYPNIVYWIC